MTSCRLPPLVVHVPVAAMSSSAWLTLRPVAAPATVMLPPAMANVTSSVPVTCTRPYGPLHFVSLYVTFGPLAVATTQPAGCRYLPALAAAVCAASPAA